MSDQNSADASGGRSPWARRLLIAVVVVFVGVIVYRLVSVRHGGYRHQPPQSVGVAAVTIGEMPETIRSLGTVTAIATVTVVPQLSGFLTEVGFTEGQDVAKGQFLAQIDPRPYEVQLRQYQAALAKDQAALDQAKSDLARYRRLARQTSIAEQQVTDQEFLVKQDEAAVEGDKANIATAQLDLGYCHITAPIAGRVGLRLIDPGNYVTASSSTGIVVITAMKPISVIFTVPQNQLTDVLEHFRGGAKLPVTAFSSDNTTKLATGTLMAVSNQVSTTTGTVELPRGLSQRGREAVPQRVRQRLLARDDPDQRAIGPDARGADRGAGHLCLRRQAQSHRGAAHGKGRPGQRVSDGDRGGAKSE